MQEIFWILCKQFQDYLMGKTNTKYVTKESITRHLIDKGLMQWSYDKQTHEDLIIFVGFYEVEILLNCKFF